MALLNHYKINCIEAGCDEAGRGCLAGPVFAAAVILPPNFSNSVLNDSKQLKEKTRVELRTIIEQEALAWAIASCSPTEIDELNILRASIKAMHRAIEKLNITPEHLIIDGNKFYQYKNIAHKWIIKGDAKYMSIAAASVLAKTYRDDFMKNADIEFPEYGWKNNMGYPTKQHKAAINNHGICHYHRKSFKLFDTQLKINFDE